MTDEEANELIREIFISESNKLDLPENFQIVMSDGGNLCFTQALINSGGKAGFAFTPNVEYFKPLLKFEDLKLKYSEEFRLDLGRRVIEQLISVGLKSLIYDIEVAFDNFLKIPEILVVCKLKKPPNPADRVMKIIEAGKRSFNERIDDLLAEQLKAKKKRLSEDIGFFEEFPTPIEPLFGFFYSKCKPLWEEAKKCYRRNKHEEDWKSIIEVAYKCLPGDLISRLNNKDPYISSPSKIALEHAARLCGDDRSSSNTTFSKYLLESRNWMGKNGEEVREQHAKDYFQIICTKVDKILYIAELAQEERDFTPYPYIFRLMATYLKNCKAESHPPNYVDFFNLILTKNRKLDLY